MKTVDEVKQQVTMSDVLNRYGLKPNRAGFIKCPFHHGDNHASLRVYDRSWHCFGCNANGDIFDFVGKMEGLDFKGAFLALGGEYDSPAKQKSSGFLQRYQRYRWQKEKEAKAAEEAKAAQEKRLNMLLIGVYRKYLKRSEVFSDAWCDSFNELQKQLLILSDSSGFPYDEEVIRLE